MLLLTDKNKEFSPFKRLKKLDEPKKRAKNPNLKDLEPGMPFFNIFRLSNPLNSLFTDKNKEFSLFKRLEKLVESKKRAKDPNFKDFEPRIVSFKHFSPLESLERFFY